MNEEPAIGLHLSQQRDAGPPAPEHRQSGEPALSGQHNAGQNVYGYVGGDPLNGEDPLGLSSVVYNQFTNTLSLYDQNGQLVGNFPAGNNTVNPARDSGSNPPYNLGNYPYTGWSPKPVDPNGPFGSNGVFHFPYPGCPGCEVHAGRANKGGPIHLTEGCIRTTDAGTAAMKKIVDQGDRLTHLAVIPFTTGGFAAVPNISFGLQNAP